MPIEGGNRVAYTQGSAKARLLLLIDDTFLSRLLSLQN